MPVANTDVSYPLNTTYSPQLIPPWCAEEPLSVAVIVGAVPLWMLNALNGWMIPSPTRLIGAVVAKNVFTPSVGVLKVIPEVS